MVDKLKIAAHVGAQLALWFFIKVLLNQYFSTSGGSLFISALGSNVHFLSAMEYYNLKLGDFERIFRYVFLLSNFGFVYLIVIAYWGKLDDEFLRRSTLAFLPFFVAIIFVGNIFELRLYGELLPFVLMPAIYIVTKLVVDSSLSTKQSPT